MTPISKSNTLVLDSLSLYICILNMYKFTSYKGFIETPDCQQTYPTPYGLSRWYVPRKTCFILCQLIDNGLNLKKRIKNWGHQPFKRAMTPYVMTSFSTNWRITIKLKGLVTWCNWLFWSFHCCKTEFCYVMRRKLFSWLYSM